MHQREKERRSEVHGHSNSLTPKNNNKSNAIYLFESLDCQSHLWDTLQRQKEETGRKERGMKERRVRMAARDSRPERCKMSHPNLWHRRLLSSPHLTDPLPCPRWSTLYIETKRQIRLNSLFVWSTLWRQIGDAIQCMSGEAGDTDSSWSLRITVVFLTAVQHRRHKKAYHKGHNENVLKIEYEMSSNWVKETNPSEKLKSECPAQRTHEHHSLIISVVHKSCNSLWQLGNEFIFIRLVLLHHFQGHKSRELLDDSSQHSMPWKSSYLGCELCFSPEVNYHKVSTAQRADHLQICC